MKKATIDSLQRQVADLQARLHEVEVYLNNELENETISIRNLNRKKYPMAVPKEKPNEHG